jgi:hypothetical protein
MNSLDRARLVKHTKHLICLHRTAAEQAKGDPWINRESRQAYHDALNSLVQCHFIKDFDLRGFITFPNDEILDVTTDPATPVSKIPR